MRFSAICFVSLLSILLAFVASDLHRASAEDWPQWRGTNRDGVWHETGLVEKFAAAELPIKWRAKIGAGYSGPTIAAGKVYVTDRVPDRSNPQERVHCFDEKTGEPVWSIAYPCEYGKVGYAAGPRAAVTIHAGKAYALGATGWLHCLDAATGKILWKRDLETDYQIEMPIWGITAAPLVEGDLLLLHIGGKDGACIVAVNKDTGADVWRALNDRGQYSTPLVVNQGGKRVAICWTGDSVTGLDVKDGKTQWSQPWKPRNMPIGVATPVIEGDRVFFTSFYDGSLLLKLDRPTATAEKLWHVIGRDEKNTDALHSIISTPVFENGYIYGVDSYGELRCLDAKTGDRVWEDTTAVPKARWSTIHFVKNGDRYFLFNERGELIIAKLSPQGYHEISRAKLIEPTLEQLRQRGGVCWSHPGYANKCVFARNDNELVCASLAKE
ncbi:Outer membrane protein assembly factor BamB precursor [Anatilimnocola aggregata]|uniref:Outer membrane protein assembly factor BamB n=1 Tax=Anatilimnocola aggregata TaxID=2528021 RepID=A0A517Y836_9BACT|nr:PQQ-binding-like beta-propeller repeat protein [Anatilimnocola aggregata]QDU26383.1 Outer membrane protein assembly factor BamB precursor [Anatilimnocola aggregata]